MTAFYLFIFIADFFFCLRRSGLVVGARENGLGARPNFLYAGKTLHTHIYTMPMDSYASVEQYTHTHTRTHTQPLDLRPEW